MTWHHNNGLAFPDHLQTESGVTTQGTGPSVEITPAQLVGTPQADPWALPAPYTDVPMGDVEDIIDWKPDPTSDHS